MSAEEGRGQGETDDAPRRSSWSRRLLGTAVDQSEGETWVQARREWIVDYEEDAGAAEEVCVCGYEGLRYLNMVRNTVTGARLFPVGSTCVERFEDDRIAEEQADAHALRVLREHAVAGDLDREHYSRRGIDALHRARAIDGAEHALVRRVFNKGTKAVWPPEVLGRFDAVIRDRVVPFLRESAKLIAAERADLKKQASREAEPLERNQ